MSFGGATAAEFCKKDSRCKAGINIDGSQYGELQRQPLTVPFLMFSSADGAGQNEFLLLDSQAEFHEYVVWGARHGDFTDFTMLAPLLKRFDMLGSIPGERMIEITNIAVREFLDRYLKELTSAGIATTEFPEIEFTFRNTELR